MPGWPQQVCVDGTTTSAPPDSQQLERREADRRPHQIDKAGNEESDAHEVENGMRNEGDARRDLSTAGSAPPCGQLVDCACYSLLV